MKTNSKKIRAVYSLVFLCIAVLIAITQQSCSSCCNKKIVCHSWRCLILTDSAYQHISPDTTTQIVVWRVPGSDDTHLNSWLDSIQTACGDVKILLPCSDCDSSLMLLTGAGIKTFIQGNGGGKGGTNPCDPSKPNCGPTGDGDTLYWSVNYPVEMNPVFDDSTNYDSIILFNKKAVSHPIFLPAAPAGITSSSPVTTVAVFDTGIDSADLKKGGYLYQNSEPACLGPTANNGWNFPNINNAVNDDYINPRELPGHGATVAKLVVEQVRKYAQDNVRILPVKTHSNNGSSDLFSILCGFAYAKERGAQIINASFGYYSVKKPGSAVDESTILFKKYIQYYLTQNGILLIAAAGNQNDRQEKDAFKAAGLTPPSQGSSFDWRNLNDINFYPASFAADPDLPNVIAVTTVSTITNDYAPDQNYSTNVVDIGVNADKLIKYSSSSKLHYYFENPRFAAGLSSGSSYATPIVTGIIASLYSKLKTDIAARPFNKKVFLGDLLNWPYGKKLNSTDPLATKIKTGIIFNKAIPYDN